MGTGQGQGGQQGGMMGQMPQGGIASLMGGMPPGMGGPMPQQGGPMGGQQMGPRVDQFGRPSATGSFAFDPQQQQRMTQAGLNADQLASMTPDQQARFQPMAPVDMDPSTGRPIDAQKQSQIMAQQAFANQQQGGMRGQMPQGAPQRTDMTGGAPMRPGVVYSQPPQGMMGGQPGFSGPKPSPAMMGGQMPQGGPGMGRPISPRVPSTMQRGLPQGVAGMFRGFR